MVYKGHLSRQRMIISNCTQQHQAITASMLSIGGWWTYKIEKKVSPWLDESLSYKFLCSPSVGIHTILQVYFLIRKDTSCIHCSMLLHFRDSMEFNQLFPSLDAGDVASRYSHSASTSPRSSPLLAVRPQSTNTTRWNPFEDSANFSQLTEDHLFGQEFDKIRRGSQSSKRQNNAHSLIIFNRALQRDCQIFFWV